MHGKTGLRTTTRVMAGGPGPSPLGTGDRGAFEFLFTRLPQGAKLILLRNPAQENRRSRPVKPPNSRGISKPNKTKRKSRNKTHPSLPIILHQKRTIEETDQVRIPWKQVHSAPAKTSQKVHKSAQNTPGNHPPTTTPSTTYEEFPAKTPHPPFLTKTRMELAQPAPIDSG